MEMTQKTKFCSLASAFPGEAQRDRASKASWHERGKATYNDLKLNAIFLHSRSEIVQ